MHVYIAKRRQHDGSNNSIPAYFDESRAGMFGLGVKVHFDRMLFRVWPSCSNTGIYFNDNQKLYMQLPIML